MTVIFKDYKAATSDEKAFYYLYLDGVREGIIELNVVLEEKRQQPLFCLPEKLELTVEQAEDITMRQAQKITDPISFLLDFFSHKVCKIRFPATKSISRRKAATRNVRFTPKADIRDRLSYLRPIGPGSSAKLPAIRCTERDKSCRNEPRL